MTSGVTVGYRKRFEGLKFNRKVGSATLGFWIELEASGMLVNTSTPPVATFIILTEKALKA